MLIQGKYKLSELKSWNLRTTLLDRRPVEKESLYFLSYYTENLIKISQNNYIDFYPNFGVKVEKS